MNYDSTLDTMAHIARVRELLELCRTCLAARQEHHDASKLIEPEKSVFDAMTPKLKGSTYGSEEYKGFLAAMKPALDHHYASNRHHPEHNLPKYQSGNHLPSLRGMTLLDLLEMLCDWKAAGERHANGNIEASLKHNRERFGISDEMFAVLENTARELEWMK
jgi:hypothetical protein